MMTREANNAVQKPGMYSPRTIRSVNCSIQVFIIRINPPKLTNVKGKDNTNMIGRIVTDNKLSKNPATRAATMLFMVIVGSR